MQTPLQPKNLVAVMGADAQEAASICRIIREGDYRTATCSNLNDLTSILSDPCMAAFLDLDSVPLDNRTIRALALAHPATCFLCISGERFHPDLQEAIRHHLFACLHKPVDPDELHYFLRCIRDDATESRGPPEERA
ncbi:MAG: hypothetical protein KFF68_02260 [Desulfosarcina sp.]|nr:hypothetical protein [Desulfosarcina sp.]